MPSAESSCGVWMVTGFPSNLIWPSSYGWAPDRPLMRVDFPAPLSPTRADTLPGWTLIVTPLRTSTGPKLLRMSSSSISALIATPAAVGGAGHTPGDALGVEDTTTVDGDVPEVFQVTSVDRGVAGWESLPATPRSTRHIGELNLVSVT